MTLPSSGPLSLANIQTEFGGSNPISMSEYYAGGAYVPTGASGTNGAVPSSGALKFSNFYGTYDFLDQQVVTIGAVSGSRGFRSSVIDPSTPIGSISDGTFNPKSANVMILTSEGTNGFFVFSLQGIYSNDGWSTISFSSGGSLNRVDASFTASGGYTQWIWSFPPIMPFGNSGDPTGGTVTCTFT